MVFHLFSLLLALFAVFIIGAKFTVNIETAANMSIESEALTAFPENTDTNFEQFTSGTGFFINSRTIVTNNHVTKNCKHIRVRGAVKPSYAKVVARSSEDDLSLLVTNNKPQRIATLRSSVAPNEGEPVMVIGYPLDHGIKGNYLIKQGIITHVDGDDNYGQIQFSDMVNKGNSGGPLIDNNGSVLGVVVGKIRFYLANNDNNKTDEPVKTNSVAIGLDRLIKFLDKEKVLYKKDNNSIAYSQKWGESRAKGYTVNIHCVKG